MKKTGVRRYMAPLLRYFGEIPVDRIDQRAIDAAAEAICPNGSPGTRNRAVYSQISVILKGAGLKVSIKGLKPAPGIVRWISPEEAGRLVAACSPHLQPLVLFLLYTGARAGEALWLDWSCVDLGRAHVSIPATKNGDPRGIHLHPVLHAALANLPGRTGCVFRRPDGEPYEPLTDPNGSAGNRIFHAFKGACQRAGLTNFRVHDLRHTWATWHYQEHHDLLLLKKHGGWRSLAMVLRYAHANSENDRSSIDALPTIWGISGISNSKKREII
jgi:integrase